MINKNKINILILMLFILINYCKSNTFRVFFKDKGTDSLVKGTNIYNNTLEILSKRCLARRAKVLSPDSLIAIEDAPINDSYINEIENLGVKILLKLRWRNLYCY